MRWLGAVAVCSAALATLPGTAEATVSFERMFGVDVDFQDSNSGDFENCAAPEWCRVGTATGAAGGLVNPEGIAVDRQGRILVSEVGSSRVSRFTVAADGTVAFDRAFGLDVDPSDGDTGDFENCTAVTGCRAGTIAAAPGAVDPRGLAVDASGGILVTDRMNNRVSRFTAGQDGVVAFDRAFGIDVDPSDGNTGDFENCTAVSGCNPGATTAAAGGLNSPQAIAVDRQGGILVAAVLNDRIDRFTRAPDGTIAFDRAFGIDVVPGNLEDGFETCTAATGCIAGADSSGPGAIRRPTGVAVDSKGRILVSAQDSHRILRFAVAAGGAVSFDRAFGVDVDPSDGTTGDFENCTVVCQDGTASAAAGGLNFVEQLAVDAQDSILVANRFGQRIDRFRGAGDGPVTFDRALGVDIDPTDPPTGSEFENCTTATGCRVGSQSSAAGGLNTPIAVTVDPLGRILVADRNNNRVQRFTAGPTVTVTKALVPASDPGTFDLRVDGAVVRAGAGHGQSGGLQVAAGTPVTVSEVAGADHLSSIDCGGGPQAGSSLMLPPVTGDVVCTITNTRKRTVTLVGALAPAGDPGRFDLRVADAVVAAAAGDGASGSLVLPHGAAPAVSAVAAAGTDAEAYTTEIACDNGQSAAAASLALTALAGDVTCTITNTRKAGPPTPTPTPGPGPGPGPIVPPVVTPPPAPLALITLRLQPGRFRALRSGPAIQRRGARLEFSLTKAARVRFTVERIVRGQPRPVRGGRFSVAGRAGLNRLRFSGRVGGRALASGRYQLSAVASAGGESSRRRTLLFRIR